MTVQDYPATTYNDTGAEVRVITDLVSLIDPSDTPLVNALGGLDGASGKFRFTGGKSTVVEWLEDSLIAIADTMTAISITSDSVSLVVTDGSLYEVGHVIQIESEHLWVSAVNTNTLTVSRGQFGSTAATHTSSTVITMVGMARLEGAESATMGFNPLTTNSNWSQIFHREVHVTRTEQQMSKYGIADTMAYHADKAVPELMRLIERHALIVKTGQIGSVSTPRAMKGLPGFITTNLVSGATLAQSQFETAVMSIYKAGGSAQLMAFVAPENKQKIKNWYDYGGTASTSVFRVDRTETTVGMDIENIVTPFGKVALVMDRWCPTGTIPILDPNNVGFMTYYPFTQKPLAVTGDYEHAEVVGEFTLCLRQQKSHALLTAVS